VVKVGQGGSADAAVGVVLDLLDHRGVGDIGVDERDNAELRVGELIEGVVKDAGGVVSV
jgi:hypothetical protein